MRPYALKVVLLGCAAISTPVFAQAWTGGGGLEVCTALLAPTEIDYQHSIAETYAYSQAEQYNSSKGSAFNIGVTVPIYGVPVSLNGSGSKSSIESQMQNLNINWSLDEQTGYLATYIPASAGNQFNTCVQNIESAQDGKAVMTATPTADGALISVSIHPVAPGGPSFRRISMWTNGSTSDRYRPVVGQLGGNVALDIARTDPAATLKVHIQVTTLLGGVIEDSYLDLPPLPTEKTINHSSALDSVRCGGKSANKQYSGTQVEVDAGPDEVLYPDTAKIGDFVGIKATGGDHPDKFPHGAAEDGGSAGFEFTYASTSKIIGHAWCQVSANENPGDSIGFIVLGKTIVRPTHSGNPMTVMKPVGTKLL